ncbi:prepilin-type N-terminal cleavage/methylation domain-containing protein [Armatimonas rosea]|uniref:Prepilin-type N-terminal cleavage/methylation domain-containing protein n=2 Tax=Armatimonas rosea TaxID=685828 RepID=A0A7W9W962_ARMRO|nr:prepilin-type N-terminal cleavage/methylation domain-containing protein [Armatimonas rosea]
MVQKQFRRRGFTLVEVMMVVCIVSVVFAIAAPNLRRTRENARARGCLRNLRVIDSAKEQYAMDNKLAQGSTMPALSVLCGNGTTTYIKGGTPFCQAGGTYTPNNLGTDPSCSVGTNAMIAHILP